MRNVITVQHCQAIHHINKMVGGSTEWELTQTGLRQAKNIGLALKAKIGIDSGYKIYSSDMIRTTQTAEIIGDILNITPIYHKELREINLGSATGKSRQWFKENEIPRPKDMPWLYHKSMADAESGEDVFSRVSKFADEIEDSQHENIIVVGHGGSLSFFAARWLKIPLTALETTAFIGSAGGVSFFTERDDGARVLSVWNDVSYMTLK